MRCLHVIPYMNPRAGGPVVAVDRFCRRLRDEGWESAVYCADGPDGETPGDLSLGDGVASDLANGQRAVSGATPSIDDEGDRAYELRCFPPIGRRRYGYSRRIGAALDRAVRQADLVHVHTLWTHPGRSAARACLRHDVPYVLMPHGMLDPHSLWRKRLKKRLYGRLSEFPRLRRARAIVYTTPAEQQLAQSQVAGLPPGYVVPLAADDPPIDDRDRLAARFLAKYPELAGRPLVTHLGRVHPKKGIDLLICAFARIAGSSPAARLLVIGPDDEGHWPRYASLAAKAGVDDRVVRIPMLTGADKWSALAASTVFALPSYQENFGIAVVEALRVGTPVVISDRVNLSEQVARAGAGLIVAPDADQVARAIASLLSDNELRGEMSARANRLAREELTWSRSGQRLASVYAQVLAGSGG